MTASNLPNRSWTYNETLLLTKLLLKRQLQANPWEVNSVARSLQTNYCNQASGIRMKTMRKKVKSVFHHFRCWISGAQWIAPPIYMHHTYFECLYDATVSSHNWYFIRRMFLRDELHPFQVSSLEMTLLSLPCHPSNDPLAHFSPAGEEQEEEDDDESWVHVCFPLEENRLP